MFVRERERDKKQKRVKYMQLVKYICNAYAYVHDSNWALQPQIASLIR